MSNTYLWALPTSQIEEWLSVLNQHSLELSISVQVLNQFKFGALGNPGVFGVLESLPRANHCAYNQTVIVRQQALYDPRGSVRDGADGGQARALLARYWETGDGRMQGVGETGFEV